MQNSIQELQLQLAKKSQEEVEKTTIIAESELEKLRSGLSRQLQNVLDTTLEDTEKIRLAIEERLQGIEKQNRQFRRLAVKPWLILVALMFVVTLASVGGGKLWLEYQMKQIVELNREEAKLEVDLLSLKGERKFLTNEINGMKIQKLKQLESEKIQVMISGSEMYLVFPKESAKPDLYLSTEEQWVVKRRLR